MSDRHADLIIATARNWMGTPYRHQGSDKGIGTGRCAAMMGTGFECDIGGGATRPFASLGQRFGFGMRPAAKCRDTAPDNNRASAVIADNQRADGRVCGSQTGMLARQPHCRGHETPIRRLVNTSSHASADILFLAFKFAEHLVEILGFSEIPVDRGKTHIGDIIERFQ